MGATGTSAAEAGLSPRQRRLRLLSVPVAFVLGVVSLELGLRVYADAVRPEERTAATRPVGDAGRTVLCLGDSFTYGYGVRADEAYPALLEELLTDHAEDGPYRVANVALPGLTSRDVRDRLPAQLDRWEPEVAVLMIGVNNRRGWIVDEALRDSSWWEELQLVKVVRLLAESREAARLVADPVVEGGAVASLEDDTGAGREAFRPGMFESRGSGIPNTSKVLGRDREGRAFEVVLGAGELDDDKGLDMLEEDVAAIRDTLYARGVRLVLLGYTDSEYGFGIASGWLREIAEDEGVPFVDVAPTMAELVARHGRHRVSFPDRHPRQAGHHVLARHVYGALVEAGMVAGCPCAPPLDAPVGAFAPPPLTVLGRLDGAPESEDELRVEIQGELADSPIRLLLSVEDADAPRAELLEMTIPLACGPLLEWSRDVPWLRGRTDAEGALTVPIGRHLDEPTRAWLQGRRLELLYVRFGRWRWNEERARWISNPLAVAVR